MKKNVLILLSVLVIAMFIVGCAETINEDLPPGSEEDGALSGQAGKSYLPLEVTEEDFNENGLLLDTKMNYITFTSGFSEYIDIEDFFSTVASDMFYVYDTTTGKIFIPEWSPKYTGYQNSGWIDGRKAAGKWLEILPLNSKLMIYMINYPVTLEPTVETPVTPIGDNYLCPECKIRETTSDYYIGGFTDDCCESVPGCHWEGSPTSPSNPGKCISDIDGKVEGIATGCADYSAFTSGSSIANRARDLACADPCMFSEGAGANDVCELGEGVTVKGIAELNDCNNETVIKHKEVFMTPDGDYFEYNGADDIANSNPKIKIKDLQTGETLERSVNTLEEYYGDIQVGFDLKHEGITYNFVNASSADVDDWDIKYFCEEEVESMVCENEGTLLINETQTFFVGNNSYEIEFSSFVYQNYAGGIKQAGFNVNNETVTLIVGESKLLGNGLGVGLKGLTHQDYAGGITEAKFCYVEE